MGNCSFIGEELLDSSSIISFLQGLLVSGKLIEHEMPESLRSIKMVDGVIPFANSADFGSFPQTCSAAEYLYIRLLLWREALG